MPHTEILPPPLVSPAILVARLKANVPAALRELPWAGFVFTERVHDGWGKPPVNPATRFPAKITKLETFGSFEAACAVVGQHARGGYEGLPIAGIGILVTADSGLVVIDLDKCRDPATGAIAPWAMAIVKRCATYTEVSPSGTGLHLIARGTKPGPRCKGAVVGGGAVEMYDGRNEKGEPAGRFLTITGDILEVQP